MRQVVDHSARAGQESGREGQAIQRLLLRPEEAAEMLAISRSKLYELLAIGELSCVHVGRSVRVPTAALHEWVARQAGGQPASTPTRGPREGDAGHRGQIGR